MIIILIVNKNIEQINEPLNKIRTYSAKITDKGSLKTFSQIEYTSNRRLSKFIIRFSLKIKFQVYINRG